MEFSLKKVAQYWFVTTFLPSVGAHAALVVQNKVLVVVAATCSGCNTGERQFTYGGQAVAIAEAGKAWFGAMMNTGTVAK